MKMNNVVLFSTIKHFSLDEKVRNVQISSMSRIILEKKDRFIYFILFYFIFLFVCVCVWSFFYLVSKMIDLGELLTGMK